MLRGSDIRCLAPKQWLSDSNISFCIQNLTKHFQVSAYKFLNPNFAGMVATHGHREAAASIFLNEQDLVDTKTVYVVWNQGNSHWVVVFIYMNEKSVEYHDPYWGFRSQIVPPTAQEHFFKTITSIRQIIREVYYKFFGETVACEILDTELSQWKYRDMRDNTPQQSNGYDCGLFAIYNIIRSANELALEKPPTGFREHILLSSLKGSLDL